MPRPNYACPIMLQELIDRLAAENAISEQDSVWLIYGASQPTPNDPKAESLANEIQDLNQQVTVTIFALQPA